MRADFNVALREQETMRLFDMDIWQEYNNEHKK